MTDDARTVSQPRAPGPSAELPLYHHLEEFVIEALIGEGGFSIVYLALDTRLNRRVALKEYMPASLGRREADWGVAPRTEALRETYERGLRSFVNEARLLAGFEHRSLVEIYRFWEGHGTAYIVMPYYQGPTLKQYLKSTHPRRPDEAWLRALLAPLIDVLERVHAQQVYHRDIAPDNILLLDDEGGGVRPLLLDFGAARQVIGDATQALTVILKPGYAPIEQYADSTPAQQGPWTDVYALGAVMYACVTGRAPIPSASRVMHDALVPARVAGAGLYTQPFLEAIDAALAVRPEQRPASMAALRALLEGPADPAPAAAGGAPALPPATAPPATRLVSRAAQAGLGATLVLGAAAWWWWPPAVPTPAPQPPAPQPLAQPAAPPASAAAAPPASAAAPLPSARAGPFSTAAALHDIFERRDSSLVVQAATPRSVLVIGRDRVELTLSASEGGYVYLLFASSDRSRLYLLFPNARDRDNRIEAGRPLVLPRGPTTFEAAGPPGLDQLLALVSRQPRDFAGTGLATVGATLPEFNLGRAEALWQSASLQRSPFVGRPVCPGPGACGDEGYGAALLELSEVEAGR